MSQVNNRHTLIESRINDAMILLGSLGQMTSLHAMRGSNLEAGDKVCNAWDELSPLCVGGVKFSTANGDKLATRFRTCLNAWKAQHVGISRR